MRLIADSLLPNLDPKTGPALPNPDRVGSVLSVSKRGFHRIAYTEWGDIDSPRVVVCVHGLTRQGRDFDHLAAQLAEEGCRVICPDLAGRGRSDWLDDPADYALPQYGVDLTALLARLNVPTVEWVGTSLGGLIGMILAGQQRSPIRRLVVNDVGPFLPWQALQRLGANLRQMPADFPDYPAVQAYYRKTLAPFGPLDDAAWDHLIRHSVAEQPNGRFRPLCDPNIGYAFRPAFFYNLNLWHYWDDIRCPTLVLRGEHSDLLLPDTAREMLTRGPQTKAMQISGVGHAPALMDPDQIGLIADWLAGRKFS
jgi:pimeloyl-ACP methyl ester carboxylesterase